VTKLSYTAFLVLFIIVFSSQSYAKDFTYRLQGKVISVTDGDTVTVLDSKKRQWKVRLAGIDAPEKAQPYGEKSKKYLAALVYKKNRLRRLVQKG